jgi:internalin A
MLADPASRPWHRFLRFSVRGLIVLVLVIGVGLGWIVRQAHVQRDAVAAIQEAGGSVRYDWEWGDGNVGKPWAPQWLVDLIGVDFFGHVTAVWVAQSESDVVIAQVGRLTRLQYLGIWSLSDARLANLKGLTKLTSLGLYGPQVTDARLAHLKGMTNLSFLHLHHTQVTDAGLAHLKGLTNLSELYIVGNQVTLAGLIELNQALPNLKISH